MLQFLASLSMLYGILDLHERFGLLHVLQSNRAFKWMCCIDF
jgi:hypothetical protein